jgi:predicted PurR-regulated permease PerM
MAKSSPPQQPLSLTISTKTYVRIVLLIIGTILLLAILRKATHAFVLIFGAFFLSLALNAPVYWLSQRLPGKQKGSRSIATTLSFLVVILVLGGLLAVALPPLVRQTDTLVHAAPRLVSEFRSQNSPVGKLIRKYHLQSQVTKASRELSSYLSNAGGTAFTTAKSIGSSIFSLVTILALTFMMLVEGPRALAFFQDTIPQNRKVLVQRMAHDMYRVIKGYVNGQVILAAIASFFITIGLVALHIPYAAALIVVVFVCGLIPMVGHTIGAVIISIVALFHSTSSALIILIYYLLYQQFENYIIQPRIQSNTTNMSPLLVFGSVVIGVNFGGLLGGLVAIPVAGCLRIVVLEYLRSRNIIETPLVKETINNATGGTK